MSNNPYYDQDTEFITGFAGSGKSQLLAKKANSKSLVLVPTHKAALVLQNKGVENVYTIHSVLKLVPTINENFRKKMVTKLKRVGSTDLSKITDIYIDECFMISTEIVDMLMAALPDEAKVTFMGDPYQLPTITGTQLEVWEPVTELNVQYRSQNVAGTNMFMAFMRSIRDNKPAPLLDPPKELEWRKMFNPDTDRILAYTNQRVQELNNMVADDKPFYYNETLIMNGLYVEMVTEDFKPRIYPTCVVKGALATGADLIKKSESTTNKIAQYNTNLGMYKQVTIKINDESYLIYYDPDHYATSQRLKHDVEKYQQLVIQEHGLDTDVNIPGWCKANRQAKYVYERGKAWSKYLAHTNYVFSLSRPHATTVHKAQGSEFSTVFIDVDNLKIANHYNTDQYKRLMYVALSRAINNVVFI